MNEQPQPRPHDAVQGGTTYPPQTPYLDPTDFDAKRLAQLSRAKRGRRGLRDTARETGIYIGTLSRIESTHHPNYPELARIHFEDFLAICKWLGVSPAELVISPTLQKILAARGGPSPRPTDAVLGKGRPNLADEEEEIFDPKLEPEVARALASIILAANSGLPTTA
ncbi:helix-turn-helix transcriptional regulator [Microcoleus sp. Pol11C1]|uniref:helix-turn-helix transcriptional regulator n=1 Tax=unclassified Microcoleus TaxID=2642155 RepID=UPI002FD2BE28